MADSGEKTPLPNVVEEFAGEYPQVWEAYERLGLAASEAGPLDEKTQRLIKLGIAIGAERTGAVHSHARRALAQGCTPKELIHVGILAITTIGWSGGFAAITWIQDVIAKKAQKAIAETATAIQTADERR